MRWQKPKGQRLHKRFAWVQVDGWWWLPEYRKWVQSNDGSLKDIFAAYPKTIAADSGADCRSIRAFRRMLRKHPWIRGKARLCSRFKGYDVFA